MTRPVSNPRLFQRLAWPLRLTRAGLVCEHAVRAFWPLWSIAILAIGLLMLGVQDELGVELVWGLACVFVAAAAWALVYGVRRFHWPSRDAAIDRLDGSLKGRPLAALMDDQAIGQGDAESEAVWQAHRARMADRAETAKPVQPNLRISALDPFGLRYSALLVLAVALLFGSITRVGSVTELTPGTVVAANGPVWEGWVEPPSYTGKPTLYLNDQTEGLRVPQGSSVTLRFYGDAAGLALRETVSDRPLPSEGSVDPSESFTIAQSGVLSIDGPGGREWTVTMEPDIAPRVQISAEPERELDGRMVQKFTARDDYGIVSGTAEIRLNLEDLPRRHGLVLDPEPRDPIPLDLPLPISGDRTDFEETIVENFAQHPWANLPVTITLSVSDELGQTGSSTDFRMILPGRRFFDPMANAIIEQRRDLLWTRENATRISQILRAVSHRAESAFRSETAYLRLRVILRRLEAFAAHNLTTDQQAELAEAMWDLAILLEEGDLSDALERLRRAQERLSEAMRNGASDEEIAELMQELRDASRDYINQLARENQENGDQQNSDSAQNQSGDEMQMSQDDLQAMMDRIQELMEQGRMAEAQQALEELQQLMENMRVAEGQQGQGQSPGEQAMEGLADTLREQQGLSDQAFRELQEQFNPGAQAGENQGNEGRNGGQGRGQEHSQGGQQGEGEQQGQGEQQGDNQTAGGEQRGSLAERQRQLRNELQRQQNALPNVGGEAGDAAREALDRAEGAMNGAEESLREDDLAGAIDRQSEAMEALREGMRNLGEAMADAQREQNGQQGTADAESGQERSDPLGRRPGSNGQVGTQEQLLQGEDVYRRARELLDEIRRRSGDNARPDVELDYLKRLLDRY